MLRKMTMTSEIKSEISRQLIVQIASSQILSSLRVEDSITEFDDWENSENLRIINLMFKSRDIYNVKAQLRREILDSLTSIQVLIQELDRDAWMYALQKNDDNQITHLFFSKESSQSILKKNYEVLIMNCIYKTNRYKMSLLIISDQTCLHTIFYVAFCFMTQKTIVDYAWVLKQLRALYAQLNISHSHVIIIDMKKNLMRAIDTIFSDANHLLCLWHINTNVLANCKRDFVDKDAWNAFFDAWKTIVYSSSEEEFSKTWREFCQKYSSSHSDRVKYLKFTYINEFSHRFVKCFINRVLHFVRALLTEYAE